MFNGIYVGTLRGASASELENFQMSSGRTMVRPYNYLTPILKVVVIDLDAEDDCGTGARDKVRDPERCVSKHYALNDKEHRT